MILFKTDSGLSWIKPESVQTVEVDSDWATIATAHKIYTVRTTENLEALAELVQRHDLNELVKTCETAWELPF